MQFTTTILATLATVGLAYSSPAPVPAPSPDGGNSGNDCPQSHPTQACCDSSAGILGDILSGCNFNILQSDCTQQSYCCQTSSASIGLINLNCVNINLK